ncbi:cyclic-guanylate-specific phosphodiesterase [Kluyvera intermedia]|jgi:EAL domain-containing protein (putative c-di-GMP-specific phosphodiesterase class I)|uniref:Cyclic-guanylate-specific phosphodiesterase n=1 Tax=Kluyvera intermedia TaxID=61648 RepID=A0A447MPC7_KLUIN|nr:cyclic-guanylate-specific phosphodiesterase [Kluyvera intermedia]QGH28373.1 cyclic-guanylate-specific phosphodiesterase [Kluyvera intermedia]QGH37355.1 cyclic-guanylate-specific phosphodiesterase [Kluyvera intermedia]WEJ83716.1 MAG: cyclic-guanylate-specific phosphodiesterase [Kluyvera intermedia]WGL56434.1 cyclic-guanylate-specific phosphodiesterase [Kluyvera intermedia]WQD29929.1 cyclic-guanylate-specific phosphodiesterase [Kluyvera intermedia]
MTLKQVSQRARVPDTELESLQQLRYWQECERVYTYQPIYTTQGRLMAIEVLTIVTHPSEPQKRIAPDRYFAEVSIGQRIHVIKEQVAMLAKRKQFFIQNKVLASVNVDALTLLEMRQDRILKTMIETLPWLRFELVEHMALPKDSSASLREFGPLWLDDFGTGMANFSALNEVRYDYIKVARDLFIMLRKTPEGRKLFIMLLQLMNRYCEGVIVEGVETLEEWREVQNSPAAAAQGYFLSRPVPMDTLENVLTVL